ncbi:sideroflexin-4 isoform X2 [Betta splendens]|uniref:Sideroflexin-4 isoform X2 n=1 Tax=Betta splendens TaxID=158456 RepID=A0A6P7PID1_BETSP|nr:sideroflexin-4 isoform X2 [Betta splendens]
MDPNLVYWKNEGQTFISRLQIWVNLLNPTTLLCSDTEIQKAHKSLGHYEKRKENVNALTLSLSSVHADSGNVVPLVFRPPALLPVAAPLVVASLLQHSSVKPALFWQFLLQVYNAGFNYANRNCSSDRNEKMSLKQLVLITGTVSFTTCSGALPQIFIKQLGVRSAAVQSFLRSIVPIHLSAALAFFSVLTIRSEELETGIQVFDSNGNSVGISKAAGHKAVKESALSRAALLGVTAAVPSMLVLLFQGTRPFKRNSLLIAPLRHTSAVVVFGLMIPVSFSLFPQLGTINREALEEKLQAVTSEGHLFYHRGL